MKKLCSLLFVVFSLLCLFSCSFTTTICGKFNRVNSSEKGNLLGGLIGAYYASLEFEDGVAKISGFLAPEFRDYEIKGKSLYISMENGSKMCLQIIDENVLQGEGLFAGVYIKEGKEHLYQFEEDVDDKINKNDSVRRLKR